MNLTPQQVRSRVGATPVSGSPLFLISSFGPNREQAIRMVNLTATALVAYVKRTNAEASPAAGKLLKSYEQLQIEAVRASQDAAKARQLAAAENTAARRAALARSAAAFAAARLRATAASAAYTRIVSSPTVSNSVHVLAPATAAASDRRSKLQIYLFVAIVVGLILGAVLATLVTDREDRRSAGYHAR
jgi:capsular polysaccharide biosynthesis protein